MSYVNVSSIVKANRADVFAAISNPALFARFMPQDLTLKLNSSPMRISKGAEYEFRVTRFGIEQLLSLRVDEIIMNEKIVFNQSIGFFNKWSHTIALEDFKEGETIVNHFVEYDLHFGIFGKLYDDLYLRGYITKLLEGVSSKLVKK